MKRVAVGWLVGAVVGTIAWFTLSPILSDEQEDMVGWLLMGSYAVLAGVLWLRARRKTDHSHAQ
jgi:hypothetical protein